MAGAGTDLPFACTCGTVRGTLLGVGPGNGLRAECFCHDCRAAELYCGQPDPAPGAVQLYQTVPHRVRFDAGQDQLGVFSFSDTRLLRWQAKCCGAPLCLTARSPKLYFTSFRTDRLKDDTALGPIRGRAFVRKPNGKRGHEGLHRFLVGFVARALKGRISGQWKRSPFFDAEGNPVRSVEIVSDSAQQALIPGQG